MSDGGVHFEVYLKRSRRDGWGLLGACDDKKAALEQAAGAIRKHPTGSVRVSKETFDPLSRKFRSITIFEHGADPYEDDGRADRKAEIPCRGPGDLVSAHAREVIGRALKNWLERQTATVLELLHRVDLVEKLEATGTELQHAVQKIAIAQSQQNDASVQHFVKQINQLVQQSVEKLYAEIRAGGFPGLKKGELAAVAGRLTGDADRERKLRGAIAQRLKSAKDWKAKFARLLDLADEAHAVAENMSWTLKVVGEFIGEIARVDAARRALIAEPAHLGAELDALTDIYCGTPQNEERLTGAGGRLAWYFGEKLFDEARAVFAEKILSDLKSPRRLRPDDFRAELELNRSLADRLIAASGALIDPANIAEAFVMRSARLLEPEAISALLETAPDPSAQLELLISLEENVVGDANKRKLAAYIRARCGAHATEGHFIYGGEPALRRLAQLASLRRRLDAAGFEGADQKEIGERIDLLAIAIESREGLFARIERQAAPAVERAAAFLRLAGKGALPDGRLAAEARRRGMRLLATPDAKAQLAEPEPSRQELMREISELVAAARPDPDEPGAAAAAR